MAKGREIGEGKERKGGDKGETKGGWGREGEREEGMSNEQMPDTEAGYEGEGT